MSYFQAITLFYTDRYLDKQVRKGNVSALNLNLQGLELEVGILLHCCKVLVKMCEKMVLRYSREGGSKGVGRGARLAPYLAGGNLIFT
jgi:hypothetical protein